MQTSDKDSGKITYIPLSAEVVDLGPRKELESHLLTDTQRVKFQNMLLEDLSELSNLRVQNGDWAAYSQSVSCLQGRIGLLQLLLDQHAAATSHLENPPS